MEITEKEFIEKVCGKKCTYDFGSKCKSYDTCLNRNILKSFNIEIEQPKEDFGIDFEKAEQEFANNYIITAIGWYRTAYKKLLEKYNDLKDKK